MDIQALTGIIAVAVALGFQLVKDRVKIPKEAKPFVAVLLSSLATGFAAWANDVDGAGILTSAGTGAGVATGFWALLLQGDKWLGRIVKGISDATLQPPKE